VRHFEPFCEPNFFLAQIARGQFGHVMEQTKSADADFGAISQRAKTSRCRQFFLQSYGSNSYANFRGMDRQDACRAVLERDAPKAGTGFASGHAKNKELE
jgi:hypothetical protein